jgi:hypothetical protein
MMADATMSDADKVLLTWPEAQFEHLLTYPSDPRQKTSEARYIQYLEWVIIYQRRIVSTEH